MNNTYINNEQLNIDCLEGELWKDVVGYEGLYAVSNIGRVYSFKSNKIMKPFKDNKGYYQISLFKNRKRYDKKVHRIIAESFIPNPDNLPQVNHKDEIKTNNNVDNLEWCTNQYNAVFGTRIKRINETKIRRGYSKAVVKLDFDGNLLAEYSSPTEAAYFNNVHQVAVHDCCNQKVNSVKDSIYLYKDDYNRNNYDITKIRKNKYRREVICFDLSGNFIREFPSLSSAAKEFNIERTGISFCLSGRTKQSGGYIWKYKY